MVPVFAVKAQLNTAVAELPTAALHMCYSVTWRAWQAPNDLINT
jgi:hypothetical protein